MGFKTWATGEKLTASDLMTYLMKQVVVVCTSSTRPASPVEGMHIYETDTDRLLRSDGSNWLGVISSDFTANAGGFKAIGAGTIPRFYLKSTDQAVDEKVWDVLPDGDTLRFRAINDAESVSDAWLDVHRTGVTVDSVTFGAETIAPQFTATGAVHAVGAGSTPRFYQKSTDQAADEKVWDSLPVGDTLKFRAVNDAENTADEWLAVHRTGVTVDSITFSALVTAAVTGANSVAFQDDEDHHWETEVDGAWRFANRGGTSTRVFKFVGGDDTTELARMADPSANRRTSLWLLWKDASGVSRFQEVQTSASGDVDATARRYLYVLED